MRKLKLFFACLLMAVLSIGQMWATPTAATLTAGTNGAAATVNSKAAIKVGTSKKSGDMTITVGAGATTLNLHAVAWSGAPGTISLSAPSGVTLSETSLSLLANTNISGSGTDYTIETESDYLFTITLTGVNAETAITLAGATTSGKAKRFVVWEATYETGSTPPTPSKTLESVAVSGTPTKTSYTAGENFDPAGLVVTGTYDDKSQTAITSGITWSYNPSQTLALNQTSIGVTATVGEVSSEEFNISLSVIEAPTTVTFAYEDYKTKGGPSGTGSDYTMVKSQVSIGDTKFYGNNSYAHFYANGVTTITPAAGVTIKQIVLTASAENYNGYQSNGTVTASVGSVSHEGVVVTWTGSTDEAFTISHDKQIRWMTIVVTYEQGEAPAVAKPTISGETPFLGSTTVTISHDDADHIYYTTNGDAPTTSSVEYTEPFSLTETATVKAIAVKGSAESAAAEKAFTKATVLTVAEALAAPPAANQYVKGIIASITEVQLEQYFNATYTIKDEGAENSMIVYRGKYLNNADFTSLDQIMEGDEVTVYGNLVEYKGTNQLGQNNYIIVQKKIARIAWSAASYEADIDNLSGNVYPTLINNDNLAVSYSSTDISVAEIDANGVITLNATGTTTIKATYTATDAFRGNEVSYELNVVSNAIKVTISFDVDGGDAIEALTEQNALPNPLPVATKAGKNFGGWFTDAEKTVPAVAGAAITENTTLHAKWLEPYSVAEAKTVIDANPSGIANQYVAGIISQIDSYNSKYNSITYWISADGTKDNQLQVYSGLIGNAATALEKENFTQKEDLELGDEVVVTGTLKLHNSSVYEFDYNNYIYTFSRKASAGLEYAVAAVEKIVGDDAFINPLTNPNELTISYGTSNDQVAEVANDGTVTINGEGSAIITATFAGNDQYKAASVSYAITVSAAVVHGSITYVENGAKEDIANVDDATALPDPLPTVTKDNFIFDGWWTTSTFEAGSKAVAGAALTGDVILYAKWNAIPYYATVYTSNVEFTGKNSFESGGSKVVIAGVQYDAQKVGASSNQGQVVVTVPAKTHTLHFHAFTWKNKSNVISISGVTNPSVTTFDVIGDNGGGASSPYTIEGNPIDHYYSVTFDDVIEETEITFDFSSGGDKRFIMYGINQEGGVLPVLDHIVITGEATELTYEAGDVFNPAGLGVNAIYTLESVEQTPVPVDPADIEWSFDPAHIAAATTSVNVTATYSGKSANKEVTGLTVTVPATPEILATPASIDFGTVYQNAIVDAQGISVTLKAVDAATVTLDGEGFSINKAALSELNSTITVTPATTVAGTFAATVTIIDDAGVAADVVINLSMKVEAVEDLSGTWVKATSVAAGDRIIIGATVTAGTKTMGLQNSSNRAAVASTVNDLGVLTPAEGTKTFLVVDAGDGKFALQALNGKYLTSATSGTGNNLLEAANYENDNAKWTITIDGEGVASVVAAAGSRTYMKYNNGSTLFSCYQYATSQTAINIYKHGAAPEPPTPVYETVRGSLTAGNYYTLCFNKTMTAIQGASLWSFAGKDAGKAFIVEAEAPYAAGTPYLIYAESDKLEALTEEVANPVAGSNNGLYGTFSYMSSADLDGVGATHMLKNNEIRPLGTNNHLDAQRAYIKISEITDGTPSSAPGRRVRAIPMQENTATDLEGLEATDAPVKVLIDGQIYILRGEKMFDTTGRLVK